MNKFPNKMIKAAYEAAKGKVFTKRSDDLTYRDQDGNSEYNHVAMNWLEDNGILERKLKTGPYVFEYRIVK